MRKDNRKKKGKFGWFYYIIIGMIIAFGVAYLIAMPYIGVEYSNTHDLEAALNRGENPTGKTVRVNVDDQGTNPMGLFYVTTEGSNIAFVSQTQPKVKNGSVMVIQVNRVTPVLNSYVIDYIPSEHTP